MCKIFLDTVIITCFYHNINDTLKSVVLPNPSGQAGFLIISLFSYCINSRNLVYSYTLSTRLLSLWAGRLIFDLIFINL